jgi:phosphoribosylglycinamide formyltransferase-1
MGVAVPVWGVGFYQSIINRNNVDKIAIFASGTGSNARKIIEYFEDHEDIQVVLVVSNKKTAPVLEMAASFGVDQLVIDRTSFYETDALLDTLKDYGVTFIVLAGFLWLIPEYLVKGYPGQMINIHPALLPAFGGKGMYGMHVHRAVKAAGVSKTGITIHHVNEKYDEGAVIFQAVCPVNSDDTPEHIAKKVQRLEHEYFAAVIENLLLGNKR